MKTTTLGRGYLEIDEDFLKLITEPIDEKIHLIKLNFKEPSQKLILKTFSMFPKTQRYIISDNIKIYNDVFKNTMKKYYVENGHLENNIISFFKRNNKVCLNFTKILNKKVKQFLLDEMLEDILKNLEVIKISESMLKQYYTRLEYWPGNIIIIK